MQTESKACCARPPIVNRGGYCYDIKGSYETYSGLKTYHTGPSTATRGIIYIYDVFGFFIQTLRGADILATDYPQYPDEAGEFQVFMPDFFGDNPSKLENFPPKSPKQIAAINAFIAGPANPVHTLPLIAPLMDELKQKHPEIKTWGIMGTCWGGKIAVLSDRGELEGVFKASAQAHPSMLDTKDAEGIKVPHCVLPSQDENPIVMDEWVKQMKKASPESYYELFGDQFHGWLTSRADFNDQHKFEEYLRGYRILRAFFAEHL